MVYTVRALKIWHVLVYIEDFVLSSSSPLRTARRVHTTKHADIERALLLLLDLLLLLLLLAVRLAAMFWHWGLQVFVSS